MFVKIIKQWFLFPFFFGEFFKNLINFSEIDFKHSQLSYSSIQWFYIPVIKNKNQVFLMAAEGSSPMKWINILAFVLTVIVNGLAGSTTILGGKFTAEISDVNPTLITPAGYVFSIWGIIYILLGVFVVFQALPSQQGQAFQKKIGWLFALSSLLNIVWLFLWQFEYLVFSVVLMFLLLASLILIYLRLDIGISKVTMREKLAVNLPFSVYLGWITIASIANVSVTMVSLNWDWFWNKPRNMGNSNHNSCASDYSARISYKKRHCLRSSNHLGSTRNCSEAN